MKSGRVRTLKSAKYLEKRKKKFIGLISIYISCVALFLILLYGFFRIPFIQINTVVINGTRTLNQQDIQNTAKKLLVGNYIGLIPKSNFLFYPKSQILDDIKNTNKKIDKLSAEVKGASVLSIDIVEKKPEVMVCDGFKEDESDDKCYFADQNGYVFEKITDFSSEDMHDVYFKYYMNSNSSSVAIGNNFIDPNRFSELQKFVKDVSSAGIKSTGLLVSDDGSYELYVDNINQTAAVVYFDDRTPFDKTLSDFVIFWQNAMDKKLGLKEVPVFDYINLRFGNNVFYLIKNGTSTKP